MKSLVFKNHHLSFMSLFSEQILTLIFYTSKNHTWYLKKTYKKVEKLLRVQLVLYWIYVRYFFLELTSRYELRVMFIILCNKYEAPGHLMTLEIIYRFMYVS